MATSRRPLQNILWLVGERVVRGAVTATVLGAVARHLEPAGFGRLNFVLTALIIAAPLAILGLEGVVVNELIRRPGQEGAVLGTAFRLRLAAGLATAVGIALTAFALQIPDHSFFAILALGLIFQAADVIDLWFQQHLDSRRTVIARFVAILAGAMLKLWLVGRGASLPAFVWAHVADVLLVAIALAAAGWTAPYRSGRWTWDPEIARVLWQRAWALGLSGFVIALTMRLDQVLVRLWFGEAPSGIYFAATRLTELAAFVGAAVCISFFPALATAHAASPDEYSRKLQSLFDALSAIGWLVAIGSVLLGPLVIRILYGAAYHDAGTILAILGCASLFALSASARWNHILLSAPPLLNLACALLHIIVVLGLAFILAPAFGPAGIAAALVGANCVSGYATSYLFSALRPAAALQTRGLLIPFTPGRWSGLLGRFRA